MKIFFNFNFLYKEVNENNRKILSKALDEYLKMSLMDLGFTVKDFSNVFDGIEDDLLYVKEIVDYHVHSRLLSVPSSKHIGISKVSDYCFLVTVS